MKSKATKSKKPVKRTKRTVKPARYLGNSGKCVEFYDLGPFEANVAHDFTIAGIVPNSPSTPGVPSRASVMAPAFGLYRIAQVMYKITPRADTYTPDLNPIGDAAVEVPKVFWKLNRYGDSPVGFTAQELMSLGSKPIRLDDKTVTIKYKPNILLANAGAGAAALAGGSGQIKMTPWLSTDEEADDNNFALSKTNHYGHMMFIECAAAGDGTPVVCEVQARVVYEFKNPRILEGEAAATRRALTKHVKHTISSSTVIQHQGVQPSNWNKQAQPLYGE